MFAGLSGQAIRLGFPCLVAFDDPDVSDSDTMVNRNFANTENFVVGDAVMLSAAEEAV
jgi:hypothetical protein